MKIYTVILSTVLLLSAFLAPLVSEVTTTAQVILELDGPPDDTTLSWIGRFGKIGGVVGRFVTAETSSWAAVNIQAHPSVKKVSEPRVFRPMLDVSSPEVGASMMHRVDAVNVHGVDGSGVLIGIVDTGVDYSHPDLTYPNGTSKVLFLWDQTHVGRPPAGFDYGHECTPDDIANRSCPQQDTHGHGTHVAAIAVSSGVATGSYVGVAPGARLIFVKSGKATCVGASWTFDEKGILDGVSYIVSKARELGRRLVISLSLGTDIGGHDGSSPLEKALDELVSEGVVVVTAAGNSAADQRHVRGHISSGEVKDVSWTIPELTEEFAASFWFKEGDNVKLSLRPPTGESIEIEGDSNMQLPLGELSIERQTGRSDNYGWIVSLRFSQGSGYTQSVWRLRISGDRIVDGAWHGWVESDTCSANTEKFIPGPGYEVAKDHTVSIPATAEHVIAVGGYVTKNVWRNSDGREVGTGLTVGDILSFSSVGPTLDGRTKPDLTAPASAIIAAKPLNFPVRAADPDPYHTPRSGTSMAAPHVAGAAALILQVSPNITAVQVKGVLRRLARLDSFTGRIPLSSGSNVWGWGKLDARVGYLVRVSATGSDGVTFELLLDGQPVSHIQSGTNVSVFVLADRAHFLAARGDSSSVQGVRLKAYPESITLTQPTNASFELYRENLVRVKERGTGIIYEAWVRENARVSILDVIGGAIPGGRSSGTLYDSEGNMVSGDYLTVTEPLELTLVLLDEKSDMFTLGMMVAVISSSSYLLLLYGYAKRTRKLKSAQAA